MRKNNLQALCRHFELDDTGPVITLRRLLKAHLQTNREQLENDPTYIRLYPRYGRGRQNFQPDRHGSHPNDDQDHDSRRNSHTPFDDEWHGIRQPDVDIDNAADTVNPPSPPSRHASQNLNTPPSSPEQEEPHPFPHPAQERHPSTSFSTYTYYLFSFRALPLYFPTSSFHFEAS